MEVFSNKRPVEVITSNRETATVVITNKGTTTEVITNKGTTTEVVTSGEATTEAAISGEATTEVVISGEATMEMITRIEAVMQKVTCLDATIMISSPLFVLQIPFTLCFFSPPNHAPFKEEPCWYPFTPESSRPSEFNANKGEGERTQGRCRKQDPRGSGQLQIHLCAPVRQHAHKRLQGSAGPVDG